MNLGVLGAKLVDGELTLRFKGSADEPLTGTIVGIGVAGNDVTIEDDEGNRSKCRLTLVAVDENGEPIRKAIVHEDIVPYDKAPRLIAGRGDRVGKDSGFNELLGKIAEQNPHSPLADTHGAKDSTSVKVREAVHRAREKVGGAMGD